jgi:hypothetical protein
MESERRQTERGDTVSEVLWSLANFVAFSVQCKHVSALCTVAAAHSVHSVLWLWGQSRGGLAVASINCPETPNLFETEITTQQMDISVSSD